MSKWRQQSLSRLTIRRAEFGLSPLKKLSLAVKLWYLPMGERGLKIGLGSYWMATNIIHKWLQSEHGRPIVKSFVSIAYGIPRTGTWNDLCHRDLIRNVEKTQPHNLRALGFISICSRDKDYLLIQSVTLYISKRIRGCETIDLIKLGHGMDTSPYGSSTMHECLYHIFRISTVKIAFVSFHRMNLRPTRFAQEHHTMILLLMPINIPRVVATRFDFYGVIGILTLGFFLRQRQLFCPDCDDANEKGFNVTQCTQPSQSFTVDRNLGICTPPLFLQSIVNSSLALMST
ncbi:hypothetical protein ABKN59_006454 [Abortiporus biennis]